MVLKGRVYVSCYVSSIAAGSTLSKPLGLALTHDGFLYVTDLDQARVIQIAPTAPHASLPEAAQDSLMNGDQ